LVWPPLLPSVLRNP